MAQTMPYPISIRGDLDEPVSRRLFLVKWPLLIPHAFVLLFLWLAVAVSLVITLFSILFTRRYPQGLFDFNVGVLRWTWRVGFYGFEALGTDKYPPFSLESGDYPADLRVEYPGEMNRWLPLVKWLLAIPHIMIVSAFKWGQPVGLITLLALIVAVARLFTGRYPNGLFDLIIGLNRWSYRVLAYLLLMTDRYPPFRLEE